MMSFKTIPVLLLSVLCLDKAVAQCPTGTNTVEVTNNSGANVNGSLAWALNCLSTVPALTTVTFNIPGSTQIQPGVALSVTKTGAYINGNSQSGIVIDGASPAGAPPNGLSLNAPNITVEGLTIANFTSNSGGSGILVNGNNATIQGNTLTGNRTGISSGSTASVFTITNNTIGASGAGNSAGGIVIGGAPTNGMISFNEIAYNTGAGISIIGGSVLIRENSLYCNGNGITRPAPPAAPAITLANSQEIRGTALANALVEVFVHNSDACTAAPCQGKTFLGSATASPSGIWALIPAPGMLPAGSQITATGTLSSNTSAFSACATTADCAGFNAGTDHTDVSCSGGSNGTATALPAGSTLSYLWNTGANTPTISKLPAGSYTVTVTNNANGCSDSAIAEIGQPTPLNTALNASSISCAGESNGAITAIPSGGTPGYSYLWNTGANTSTIQNLSAGTYTVTVTDDNGCTHPNSATLTAPPALLLQFQHTDANGATTDGTATATASGGTPPYTFLWSNGAATAAITNLAPGMYTATATDANNCSVSGTVAIAGGNGGPCTTRPVYALYAPEEVCGNTRFTLEADDLYPGPAIQYRWLLPTGDTLTSVQPYVDLLASSTAYSGDYYVVRDSAGCRSIPVGSAPLSVLSLAPGAAYAGLDTTLCSAGVLALRAKPLLLGAGTWVALNSAKVDEPSQAITTARNLQPGVNSFIWKVSLGNCPQAAADTVVYFLEKPLAARDDAYTLQRAQDIAVMEVLLNDALAGLQDTVVSALDAPASGTLELLGQNRRFRYTTDEGYRGTVQFRYAVCNPASTCAFGCDTALVTIQVLNLPLVPEALVVEDPGPNGRLNIRNIQGFSRVSLSVTNRWGDLVFRETHYQNENPWLGDYQRSGRFLPRGAYYYALQAFEGETQIGDTQNGIIYLFEHQ